jgi:hypothetical protein
MNNKQIIGIVLFSLTVIMSQSLYSKENIQRGMGRGMMEGNGMVGHGMMGMCSSNMLENVKTNITETADGVTITYSSKDKKEVVRLQKMAKIHKLAEELNEDETVKK